MVVETAVLSETELSEYCRKKGLYPQQVKEWKHACISGADQASQRADQESKQLKQERKHIQSLEKELRRNDNDAVLTDKRSDALRPVPSNKLTEEEEQRILTISNDNEYASLPPSQIVPALADKGVYIASESSFYRILKKHGQLQHRGRSKKRSKSKKPTTHVATGPNQVWCWDISYIPSRVRGQFWYLYLILDVYSRKIVGWEIHSHESGELASELINRTMLAEKCTKTPLVLHSDNGAPMTSSTFKAKLEELGIIPSHSRPRVSNDNAFAESIFKTVKYCPQWPPQGFLTLEDSRQWMLKCILSALRIDPLYHRSIGRCFTRTFGKQESLT